MNLQEFFAENPRVAIAFSGGDSSYLLYAALHYGARARAYYVNSAFQPAFELEDARRLAGELNADMKVLPVDVLASETVTANPPDRCYHCKQMIFRTILAVLLDGTNASDDAGDRPGMRALRELAVRSPLRECGLTKRDVRMLSRDAGLFTWDKPAYACLATRIPTGQPITARDLAVTEAAESDLFSLGFTDFRVRMVGRSAKIQLPAAQMPRLLEHRQEILRRLGPDYDGVWLDLEGRG
mgnify:CR=1 FL=1